MPDDSTNDARIRQLVDQYRQIRVEGNVTSPEDFARGYPDIQQRLETELRVVEMILKARQQVENDQETLPMTGDDSGSLKVRCPNCNASVSVDPEVTWNSVRCDQCATEFSLIGEHDGELVSGTRIGQFELVEPVGMGAFGTVWRAVDRDLDRDVAIKIPLQEQLTMTEADQFFREAQASAQMNHPGIVRVFEVGRHEGRVFIASEFIDGQTLSNRIASDSYTFRESAELVRKLAWALQHAHDAGVIHRDLKPGNILIDCDRQPHIADFGLAKRDVDNISVTTTGLVLGTPAYMSPEQASGRAHDSDNRSDIYSLGVILFRLLTGELPFRGNTTELIMQVISDEPPSPRKFNEQIPRDLETICLKCLEKQPDKRYTTAREVADELQRFLENKPINARPVSGFERVVRWCRRQPVAAALIAALAVIAVAGPAAWMHQRSLSKRLAVKTKEADARAEAAEKNLKLARRNAYAARLGIASYAWGAGRARRLIDNPEYCPPDLREFGWRHIMYATDREDKHLIAHTAQINDVAFSPDQRLLASCGHDGRIVLWDTSTWEAEVIYHGTEPWDMNNVYQVQFMPDGSGLLTSDHQGRIQLWDLQSGKPERLVWKVPGKAQVLDVSPDGKKIAVTSSGLLGIGNEFLDQLLLFDVNTETTTRRVGHQAIVLSLDFSPDGSRLVSGGKDDTLRVWDTETGECVKTITFDRHVETVNFSQKGDQLFAGMNSRFEKIWTQVWRKQNQFERNQNNIFDSTFMADDHRILFADGSSIVRAIHSKEGSVEDAIDLKSNVTGNLVASSADSKLIAVAASDNSIRIRSLHAHEIYRTFNGHAKGNVCSVLYSPDSRNVVSSSGDNSIIKWDLKTGFPVWKIQLETLVQSLAIDQQGKNIFGAAGSGHIMQWDALTGQLIKDWIAHEGAVNGVICVGDSCLISCSVDGNIIVWQNGAILQKFSCGDQINGIAYNEESDWIAAGVGCHVKIYERESGQMLKSFGNHSGIVGDVCFRPDGRQLASSASGSLYLWDVDTGELVYRRNPETGLGMRKLAFSPDAKNVATTTAFVGLWDPVSGEELAKYLGGTPVSVAFAPDGNSLCYGRTDGQVSIRQAIPATTN